MIGDVLRGSASVVLVSIAIACLVMVARISSPYSPWILNGTTGTTTIGAEATLCIGRVGEDCSSRVYPPGLLVARVPILVGDQYLVYTTDEGTRTRTRGRKRVCGV